jgi:FkbM family methyltransferase
LWMTPRSPASFGAWKSLTMSPWWRSTTKRLMDMASRKVIFDIGMHYGRDSEFYLLKGFCVVAVEANPELVRAARRRLSRFVMSGRLTIIGAGVWHTAGAMTYYRNLDKDDWSSFLRDVGTREETRFEEIQIDCITVQDLVSRYSMPYYMKIDIEGADRFVLQQLAKIGAAPEFVSAQQYGLETIRDMACLGYDRFQIAPQAAKRWSRPPRPSREGAYVRRRFNGHDSGLFGRELPMDCWMPIADAERELLGMIHGGRSGEWYDVHAARSACLA